MDKKRNYSIADILLVMSYVFIAWALVYIAFVSPDFNSNYYSVHIETNVSDVSKLEVAQDYDDYARYDYAYIKNLIAEDYYLDEQVNNYYCDVIVGEGDDGSSRIIRGIHLSDLEYDYEEYEGVVHKINNQKMISMSSIVIGLVVIASINILAIKKCGKVGKIKTCFMIKLILVALNLFLGGFLLNYTVGLMSLKIHYPCDYSYGITFSDIVTIITSEFRFFPFLIRFFKRIF